MPSKPKSASSSAPIRSVDAVASCIKAWRRTFELASTDPDDDSLAPDKYTNDNYFASKQAAVAFREAMPPLYGQENIRGFIGCVAYAVLQDIIPGDEAKQLLHAADVALRAESRRAKNEKSAPERPDSGAVPAGRSAKSA